MNQYLNFSEELLQARKHNMPIVALESTIISHGMPFPQNMETALAVEQKVRAEAQDSERAIAVGACKEPQSRASCKRKQNIKVTTRN